MILQNWANFVFKQVIAGYPVHLYFEARLEHIHCLYVVAWFTGVHLEILSKLTIMFKGVMRLTEPLILSFPIISIFFVTNMGLELKEKFCRFVNVC